MHPGWTIGDRRVSMKIEALQAIVRIDDVPVLAMREGFLGEWTFSVAARTATFKRVRTHGAPASELWIEGVEIPPSSPSFRLGLPPRGTPCPLHEKGERYREPEVPARASCASCQAPRCLDCLAVDGVRCEECFASACREFARARKLALYRNIALVFFAAAVASALGVITETEPLFVVAGAIVVVPAMAAWANARRDALEQLHVAQRTPEQRALLQEGAEILAREWRRGAAAPAPRHAALPESTLPPAFGPYIVAPLRATGGVVLSSGTRVPATASIALAPVGAGQREVDLELDVGTFRATALRPLQADDRVEFTINVNVDGIVTATARDRETGVPLSVACVELGERRLEIAVAGAVSSG